MPRTYNQILTRGLNQNLSSAPIIDGKIRFATDTERLFIDFGVTRIEITDIITGNTEEQIRALASPKSKIYLSSDTYKLMYYSGGSWRVLTAAPPDPATATPSAVSTTGAVGTSTKYAKEDHIHAITLATGDSDGQVKIAGQNVSVKGLGSMAYLSSVGSSNISSSDDSFDMDFGELTD